MICSKDINSWYPLNLKKQFLIQGVKTMLKEEILKSIYKYYPTIFETSNSYKDKLRKMKINNKIDLEEKLFKDIERTAEKYAVIDWTDEEAVCYEFNILLHRGMPIFDNDKELLKKLNGVRNDLRLFISILEPYYYMFIDRTMYFESENKWEFTIVKSYNKEYKELMRKIDFFMVENGYMKLFDDDVLSLVPNVETVYKEVNTVNVFDCLFTDLVTIS